MRHVSDRYHRAGTLSEGRYKACLVDTDDYLLRCYRCIELNPARAAMVSRPEDHAWSNYRFNARGLSDPLIRPHAIYRSLGPDGATRQAAYRSLVEQILADSDIDDIRRHLQQQPAFGSQRFRATTRHSSAAARDRRESAGLRSGWIDAGFVPRSAP